MFVSTIVTKLCYEVRRYWRVALNAKDVFLEISHNSGLFSNTNKPISGNALSERINLQTLYCVFLLNIHFKHNIKI
jgi:hypothetical protein